jgi:hypothetical protein
LLESSEHAAFAMNKLRNIHSVIAREWNRVIPKDKGKSMGDAGIITTNALIHARNVSHVWWLPSEASVIFYMSFRGLRVAHRLQLDTLICLLIHLDFILTFCVFFCVPEMESQFFFNEFVRNKMLQKRASELGTLVLL